MATAILSQQTIEEAHEMAQQSHTWHPGRSKADGRPFWIIPSRSELGTAHWTTSYGCTCRGFRRRGNCAHAEAVRMVEARQLADMLAEAPAPTSRYDSLFPACRDCGDLADGLDDRCSKCASDREWSARREMVAVAS